MAYLEYQESDDIEYLREHHRLGRRRELETHLDFSFVSKLHTLIEWRGDHWSIRDLSFNGTWLNGERIADAQPRKLRRGDLIGIAGPEGITLRMADISPPQDMIYREDQKRITRDLRENLLLPSESAPEVELYRCPERNQWFAEPLSSGGGVLAGPYEHGSQLQCGAVIWNFIIVGDTNRTAEISSALRDLSELEFRFDISQDEEHCSLTLISVSGEIDLGERSHHYLLAHLLRHKSRQSKGEYAPGRGWMPGSLLCTELGIDETHLNILVYRARNQISRALSGYAGSARLLERQRGTLRAGIEHFSIYKEGVREL